MIIQASLCRSFSRNGSCKPLRKGVVQSIFTICEGIPADDGPPLDTLPFSRQGAAGVAAVADVFVPMTCISSKALMDVVVLLDVVLDVVPSSELLLTYSRLQLC